MQVLKRHCSLPEFQRMCCKSCSNVTITDLLFNSTSNSTFISSIHPGFTTPSATITLSSDLKTAQNTPAVITTISTSTADLWSMTHPPTFTSSVSHSTPSSLSTRERIASYPPVTTSISVLSNTSTTVTTSVLIPSRSVVPHSLPSLVPDIDERTDPQLQSTANTPTTPGMISTTELQATTSTTMRNPEKSTKTDNPLKFKPKKNFLQKKNPKKTIPLKINPKINTALKNTTAKDVPLKVNPKKKTNSPPIKNTSPNSNIKKIKPEQVSTPRVSTSPNTTPKITTPARTALKKATPPNTIPKMITTGKPAPKNTFPHKITNQKNNPDKTTLKKSSPNKATAKKTSPDKTTPKKTTLEITNPKKTTPAKTYPKKTTLMKTTQTKKLKPTSKNEVPSKTSSKKNMQPKTAMTRQTQTNTKPKKSPKPKTKNLLNSQAKVYQNKATVKKKNPKEKTLSYFTAAPSLYKSPEPSSEYFASTISFSTDVYGITTNLPSPEPKINATFVRNDTAEETPLWHHGSTHTEATTPSSFEDLVAPTDGIDFDAVTMSSGTMPLSDVGMTSGNDVTVTRMTIMNRDDITVSHGSVGVATETVVLDNGLPMVSPTINNEDMKKLDSSPWLDLSEYIPVGVPLTTSDLASTSTTTAFIPTAGRTAITTTASSIQTSQQKVKENTENNSIDISYNRIISMDNDISQNNLIPKRRVNLRERTRNKRIQELLEEKRNYLLRMKRGQTAQ